jgi:hypothetical protein
MAVNPSPPTRSMLNNSSTTLFDETRKQISEFGSIVLTNDPQVTVYPIKVTSNLLKLRLFT